MGFRFQKRIKLGKRFGINISKSGVTPSYRGKRGSLSSKGYSIRTGIPGLNYRKAFKKSQGSGCLLTFAFLTALFLSCQLDKSKKPSEKDQIPKKEKIIITKENMNNDSIVSKKTEENETNVLEEFNELYRELLRFKNKEDFKKYGFSIGGPYNDWLKKVKRLKKHPNSKKLIEKGFVAGELESLGIAYAASKGKETSLTKFFNEIFSQGLK